MNGTVDNGFNFKNPGAKFSNFAILVSIISKGVLVSRNRECTALDGWDM